LIHLDTTTAEEIRNGIVVMAETLLCGVLYGEIMARSHRTALAMTSITRCTQSYGSFPDFSTSHRVKVESRKASVRT
jgi:hypothetical protein